MTTTNVVYLLYAISGVCGVGTVVFGCMALYQMRKSDRVLEQLQRDRGRWARERRIDMDVACLNAVKTQSTARHGR